jgi:integrase
MKLFKRGQVWWVTHWDNERKEQVRTSTGCRDRSDAERRMMAMFAPILAAAEDERLEAVARVSADVHRRIVTGGLSAIGLAECWERSPHGFARDGRPLKAATVAEAKRVWGNFVGWCHEREIRTVAAVTEELAREYIQGKPRRMGTASHFICRAMFARLGVVRNPFAFRVNPRLGQTVHREPLSWEQIERLLAAVDSLAGRDGARESTVEFAVFLRFLIYTGLRLGDAVMTRCEQVDVGAGEMERVMAKTGRRVRFPLHRDVVSRLSLEGEYLFPALAGIYQRGQGSLTKKTRLLMDSVGIAGEPHQYCAHALRTTFASICAECGIPLAVIQSWLGHTSPSVTRIYARVEDMKAKRAALAKFPTLG